MTRWKGGIVVDSMDELVDRVQRQVYRMRDLHDQLARIRAREASEDEAMTVEVDGNGAMTALDFSDAVNGMTPGGFESTLVATAAAAAASAFARRARLIEEFNAEVAR
ncbi:hypothetical protein FNL39_102429 [Nocardia caishijiensis]|uniref:YbaB/EbfC DNA-binding family protein n=2 Tax=Nocardia caishijiensis TaxID=184756 RepID=A0ABQ6YS78_9NOCA|nr:hypothetical protein FNL39_102429 [Nocardia caishijiensis]